MEVPPIPFRLARGRERIFIGKILVVFISDRCSGDTLLGFSKRALVLGFLGAAFAKSAEKSGEERYQKWYFQFTMRV